MHRFDTKTGEQDWEFVPKGNCHFVGAIIGIAALAGVATSLIGANAAKSAAQTQANAANRASNNTLAIFNTIRSDLAPYRGVGTAAIPQLESLSGTNAGGNVLTSYLGQPFAPTQASLEATPGYQFTLSQGLRAVQNANAAQGLGRSGNALAGAAAYATGLSDQTFNTRYQQDMQNRTFVANLLQNQVGTGGQAATQTGQFGTQATQNAGQFLTSGAAASAAGTVGAANAVNSGINGISNNALLGLILQNNPGMFGGQGAPAG